MLPERDNQGIKSALATMEPYEFFGSAGDIVLWHGRLFHTATPNYTEQIRKMVLYDVRRTHRVRHDGIHSWLSIHCSCTCLQVYKRSVHDRAYKYYERGPNASPPPTVRTMYDQSAPLEP
eukprot:SAG31_NODE_11168_length_1058_cov_37.364964_2_plen_119_part_01